MTPVRKGLLLKGLFHPKKSDTGSRFQNTFTSHFFHEASLFHTVAFGDTLEIEVFGTWEHGEGVCSQTCPTQIQREDQDVGG